MEDETITLAPEQGSMTRQYTLYVNDRTYSVDEIIIYNQSGVLYSTRAGWFEDPKNHKDLRTAVISRPILKRKEKFDTTGNYIIPIKKDKYDYHQKCKLYIHESDAQVTMLAKKEVWMRTPQRTTYHDRFLIKFRNVEIEATVFVSAEDTPLMDQARKIAAELNERRVWTISDSQIAEILEYYNITPKEE